MGEKNRKRSTFAGSGAVVVVEWIYLRRTVDGRRGGQTRCERARHPRGHIFQPVVFSRASAFLRSTASCAHTRRVRSRKRFTRLDSCDFCDHFYSFDKNRPARPQTFPVDLTNNSYCNNTSSFINNVFVFCRSTDMAQSSKQVINFGAGPAKIPKEVKKNCFF